MTTAAHEVNFDGLVGPTHNYAGLSVGNLASQQHGHTISNPKAAALQGLAKMKRLADLGLKQAVLPPHDRPDMELFAVTVTAMSKRRTPKRHTCSPRRAALRACGPPTPPPCDPRPMAATGK